MDWVFLVIVGFLVYLLLLGCIWGLFALAPIEDEQE